MLKGRQGIPQLGGRVAVVTGAASGIGRALAHGLWDRGCHLALLDLDGAGLSHIQCELTDPRCRRRLTTHVVDVGDRARMEMVARDVASAHGTVHLLINNAGIGYEAAFSRTTLDEWDRVLRVNLWGVIHGCHFFLPHLAKADRAHIVNLSSLLGIVAMPGQSAYSASKFAVRGLSEALREELRGTSVGMTIVHPGAVATDIMRRTRGDDPELLERLNRWYDRHAMPPARAASRIIRAVERGTPRLLVAPETTFGDVLKRLAPVTGNTWFVNTTIRLLGLEDMRDRRSRQWRETMVEDVHR